MDTLGPANFTVIERLSSLRDCHGPVGTIELILYREVSFSVSLREVPLFRIGGKF